MWGDTHHVATYTSFALALDNISSCMSIWSFEPEEMRRCSFISEEKAPEVNEAVNEDVEKNIWRHPTVGFSRAHACPL